MTDQVVVVQTEPGYPGTPHEVGDATLTRAFEALWRAWGKDPGDPFHGWASPGGRVVLKPNWVLHANPIGHDLDSLVTHTAIIRHAIDWAARGMRETGTIVIGDAPLQGCHFHTLMQRSGMDEVLRRARERYPRIDLRVEDWRLTLLEQPVTGGRAGRAAQSLRPEHDALVGQEYRIVDLGRDSFVDEIAEYADRLRVTCYQPSLMRQHHAPGKHEYLVTRQIFGADLVVNLPKMKTHIKAGLTGALKNLVGINGHKEYLPHHIHGSYIEGGDCYYKAQALRRWYDRIYDTHWEENLAASPRKRGWRMAFLDMLWMASRVLGGDGISAGSWSGNETIWRTTLDLNHILHFSPDSAAHRITICDGIVAGEGEGPLTPSPKAAGVLIAGENPAYVDAVMARLMGYCISRVPTVYHALNHRRSRFAGVPLEELTVTCVAPTGSAELVPFSALPNLEFVKPRHWRRAEIPSPSPCGRQAPSGTSSRQAPPPTGAVPA